MVGLPEFLQDRPVASINYRWRRPDGLAAENGTGTCWPTPVHDTSIAYNWLVENLMPPGDTPRDIFIYGSHLGASLAVSLALTAAHADAQFAVRGVAAYNGIYNWTMFLKEHHVNAPPQSKRFRKAALDLWPPPEGTHLHSLHDALPRLFGRPASLFDPFASPSLFFHNPGLLVPPSFYMTASEASMIDVMTGVDAALAHAVKPPRPAYLVFPSRLSDLKIPQILLLHDKGGPLSSGKSWRSQLRAWQSMGNSFMVQARELEHLASRSLDKVEMKDRGLRNESADALACETARRVTCLEVDQEQKSLALSQDGQAAVLEWLQDRGV